MKTAFLCAVLALVACALAHVASPTSTGTNWAVVIAGSNSYFNYRHQADVCHAYQVLHAHGIPDTNIIVMMYDDIANSSENPDKGNIINKPNGPNVYTGVPKDYTGDTVTAQNFLAVISGKQEMLHGTNHTGRVVNSGPNDNIFIFFSDHGGPGLIAMPTGPYLYAKDLVSTLKEMATNKRFHQLVFYLEACESGSMFDGLLPNNINIFATTASNPDESSYACYWDDSRQAYLGDLYSVSWMENSDVADFSKETLQQQFTTVQNETSTSHVCEYGQESMSSEPLAFFQSFKKFMRGGDRTHHRSERVHHSTPVDPQERLKDVVDSRDVVLATLQRRLAAARDDTTRATLQHLIKEELIHREHADRTVRTITAKLLGTHHADRVLASRASVQHDCVPELIDVYERHCGRFSDYSLKWAYVMNNLCREGVTAAELSQAAAEAC